MNFIPVGTLGESMSGAGEKHGNGENCSLGCCCMVPGETLWGLQFKFLLSFSPPNPDLGLTVIHIVLKNYRYRGQQVVWW